MDSSVINEAIFSSRMLTGYVLVLAFILGTVFGSFINCLAWRYIADESVLKGRSHCATCGHVLGWMDLIPIVSYLVLGGKCRYCKQKISPRYLVAEVIMGIAFAAAVLRFGISFLTLRTWIAACILMTISLVDLDSFLIPNRLNIALAVVWVIFLPLTKEPLKQQLIHGLLGAAVIAGGMLLISLLFDRITGKESLGGGDIKLFVSVGLYLGVAGGLLCLILACIIGLVFVAARKNSRIPFGPSISIAFYLCLIFGSFIVNWYLAML